MPEYVLIPDPEELHDHFSETLDKIPGMMGTLGGNLETDIDQVEFQCRQFDEDSSSDWNFNFTPNWEFVIEDGRDFPGDPGRAIVGADIAIREGEYQRCSFNMSILQKSRDFPSSAGRERVNQRACCAIDRAEKWTMVRRYQFDMDPGVQSEEQKPICHLQTGGNVGGPGDFDGEFHYCRASMKKPRIPHPPMDLILVLDLLFSQYENLREKRDSDWLGLVERSERRLWKPFYNHWGSRYLRSGFEEVGMDFVANQ